MTIHNTHLYIDAEDYPESGNRYSEALHTPDQRPGAVAGLETESLLMNTNGGTHDTEYGNVALWLDDELNDLVLTIRKGLFDPLALAARCDLELKPDEMIMITVLQVAVLIAKQVATNMADDGALKFANDRISFEALIPPSSCARSRTSTGLPELSYANAAVHSASASAYNSWTITSLSPAPLCAAA